MKFKKFNVTEFVSVVLLLLIAISSLFGSSLLISKSLESYSVKAKSTRDLLSSLPVSGIEKSLESKEIKVEIVNFTTDKKVYSSHENLNAIVLVNSSEKLNVKVNFWGIKPRNYAYINETKTVNLSIGINEIDFSAITPYCTRGCGGVFPGEYELMVEIYSGDKLLDSKNLTITLTSD